MPKEKPRIGKHVREKRGKGGKGGKGGAHNGNAGSGHSHANGNSNNSGGDKAFRERDIGGLGAPGEPNAIEKRALRLSAAGSALHASTTTTANPSSKSKKRGQGTRRSLEELPTKEFVDALPRYPNDGVVLFDTKKYNVANILATLEEIALANSKEGDFVVNLGTQQFTVLALWDR